MPTCCVTFVACLVVICAVLLQIGRLDERFAGAIPALMNEERMTVENIPDLEGKVVLVTGANAGLGLSTVKHLATNGAKVYMGCRSMKKCERAKLQITKEVSLSLPGLFPKFNKANLIPMRIDLSSFESIRKFGNKFIRETEVLHSLILNAGIMHTPFGLTEDGIEQQIGVNHFGHFYLTKLLLPVLERSTPATIVSVSSGAHYLSYEHGLSVSLEELNDEKSYNKFAAYGQSKLANVLFVQELSDRLKKKGTQIFVNAVHPGAVDTDLLRHHPDIVANLVKSFTSVFPNTLFYESSFASLVEVYAAFSPEIFERELSGEYFVPIGEVVRKDPHTRDMRLQRGLWELSEKILLDKGYS